MKTKHFFLFVLIVLAIAILAGCKKESVTPQIGQSYNLKDNVFNNGAYQPTQPGRIDSLYIDATSGQPYVHYYAHIDWKDMALVSRDGVSDKIIAGNVITMHSLEVRGIHFGDVVFLEWEIPVADLKD